jgi:hypothetical protein
LTGVLFFDAIAGTVFAAAFLIAAFFLAGVTFFAFEACAFAAFANASVSTSPQ